MSSLFENFYYRKYRVNFVVLRPFSFGDYPFHLIRGIFGKILYDEVCVHKSLVNCDQCLENGYCPFTEIFKIKLQPSHPLYGKYTAPPVPYILYPDLKGRSKFIRGNTFAIELTLIGKAVEYDTFLLQVVQRLGEGDGLLYRKLECSGIETMIGDDKKSHLHFHRQPLNATRLKLHFQSPLIFEIENNRVKRLPFTALIKSLAERVSVLNRLYCDVNATTDPESFSGETANVEYIDSFYNTEVEVKKNVYKDALLGSVTYSGQLNEYMHIIVAGEVLHLGRFANYGFGKYNIEINY